MYAPKLVNLPPTMLLTRSREHLSSSLSRAAGNDYPRSPWRSSGGTVAMWAGAGGRAWKAGGPRNRALTEQAAGYNKLWYRAEAVAHKTRWPRTPLLRNSHTSLSRFQVSPSTSVSSPWPTSCMSPRIIMNAAQHKTIKLLKIL